MIDARYNLLVHQTNRDPHILSSFGTNGGEVLFQGLHRAEIVVAVNVDHGLYVVALIEWFGLAHACILSHWIDVEWCVTVNFFRSRHLKPLTIRLLLSSSISSVLLPHSPHIDLFARSYHLLFFLLLHLGSLVDRLDCLESSHVAQIVIVLQVVRWLESHCIFKAFVFSVWLAVC